MSKVTQPLTARCGFQPKSIWFELYDYRWLSAIISSLTQFLPRILTPPSHPLLSAVLVSHSFCLVLLDALSQNTHWPYSLLSNTLLGICGIKSPFYHPAPPTITPQEKLPKEVHCWHWAFVFLSPSWKTSLLVTYWAPIFHLGGLCRVMTIMDSESARPWVIH